MCFLNVHNLASFKKKKFYILILLCCFLLHDTFFARGEGGCERRIGGKGGGRDVM